MRWAVNWRLHHYYFGACHLTSTSLVLDHDNIQQQIWRDKDLDGDSIEYFEIWMVREFHGSKESTWLGQGGGIFIKITTPRYGIGYSSSSLYQLI